MDKKNIIKLLQENSFTSIEEIPYSEDALVLRFLYEFDEDEIEAAKAYSNDECEEDEDSDEWYEEYFLPYLSDLAVDSVGESIEDIMDSLSIDAQYVSYEMDEEYNYSEFIAVFFPKGKVKDIEEVLEELEL